MTNVHQESIRKLISPEIYDMLPQLPENHPVVKFQAYQLNLVQQQKLAHEYQEICTTLNDYFQRPETNRWDGDQLWQHCQLNLNAIQNNLLHNQSYETFTLLREQIRQNEEERMQFCSQQETVECYIKNFMQIPVHTYYTQHGDNNWLNYSPILMQDQKHRTYAINAIAHLLGKNLIIFDEGDNVKHHYLCSEAPIAKENTLFLRHIGNYHFNKLIFLEENEEVEYFISLQPKPILKEDLQNNSHEQETHLFPSSFVDLIDCPMKLDEGLKDLQKRLLKIGSSENKLTGLKNILLQWVNTSEKEENPNQLKEKLKELIPLLLPPEELVISSEKGDLALTLSEFYFSLDKNNIENILTHKAFKPLNACIERCEHFARLLESPFKEGSNALQAIKTLYESYKQGLLKFNPKNITELKENYKHYLAPQAEFYGTLLSPPSLIQQSIAYQLASRNLFNKVDKQNKKGTHAVRSFEGMHFKAYDHDSELSLCPGKELAMYHLYQLLIGEGVAPSTLLCLAELPLVDLEKAGIKKQVNQALLDGKDIGDLILENPKILHQIETNKTKTLFPIQVSSTIEGIGFHTFLENYFFAEWKKKNLEKDPKDYLFEDHGGSSYRLDFQKRFVEFIEPKRINDKGSKELKEQDWNKFLQTFNSDEWSLDQIDEDSFARMTLMSFLTDPGDSKADNFMLYRKNQEERNQKWNIISIDTDRVFETNLHKISSGNKKGHHKVHHKSLFYTFSLFMKEKTLSQKIKNEFKSINIPLVIAKWLLTLRDENKAYAVLQKESALPEKLYVNMKLPIAFKRGQISTLLTRLQDLQGIVKHHDFNLTLNRTFQLMHPVLHAYYEKVQQKHSDDPLARIYEDNTRENNQELTVESMLTEEELNQKDEEGRLFKDILQEFNKVEEDPQHSKNLEDNQQTIDEGLYELSQFVKQSQKGHKEPLTLLDLILEAKETDLFKRMINVQGPQAVNATIARKFYRQVIKKDENLKTEDSELLKAWDLLVNVNQKLHWYMGLENIFLTPEEATVYQKQSQKNVFKVIGTAEGIKYLSQEVWDQLIDKKNQFKHENQDGAHAVGKATYNGHTLYFKFLPKLPGLEEAVGRWTRNLIGFGAPHVELFRLDNYPILVSQGIKGLTLKEAIQKYPQRLKQLDPKSLAQVLFSTMLTNPEDGKPDNYIVEQISDNPPLYRITGIDNDQAFVPAVAKEQKKGWGRSLSVVQVKCVLYCLDQMDQPIHPEVREVFKKSDPRFLLSTWLNELDLVHERQVELFANPKDNNALLKKLFQEHDSYVGTPFKKGDLHDFYDRFLRLQKALHDPNVKTYHDLLMQVEPRLGKRYGALRHNPKSPKDLYEKFKFIDGEYFSKTMGTITSSKDTLNAKGISEKEAIEDIIKKDRHYTPKLALKELERRVDEIAKMEISSLLRAQGGNIEAFASEEFRNRFFKDIDFNNAKLDKEGKTYGPVSINVQQALLEGLAPYALHDLTLNNCQAFNYPLLQKFQTQSLTHVSLTGCPGVTSDVPIYFSEQCQGLFYLDLSRSPNLTYMAGRTLFFPTLSFANLKKLVVNQCTQLNQINIKVDQLQIFEVQDNSNLSILKVQSPTLKFMNISKSPKLTDQILDELGETSPHLQTAVCVNCPQFKDEKFRERFPFFPQATVDQKNLKKIKDVYENQLTHLEIEYSEIGKVSDKEAKTLAKNTTLTSLSLYFARINPEGAQALAKNTMIKELSLRSNQVKDTGAQALAKNTTLTFLDLHWSSISDTGAQALAQSPSLTWLDLSDNNIRNAGAQAFAYNTRLTTLLLWKNKIGSGGAQILAQNTTLTKLYLSFNNIGDEGARVLAQNTSLTSLSLNGNNIGAEGARALAQNTTLTELDLFSSDEKGNNISTETMTLIKIRLEQNKKQKLKEALNNKLISLTLFNLQDDDWMNDESAKLLSQNTTLTSLNLQYSKIGDEGIKAFKDNTTLIEATFSGMIHPRGNIVNVGASASRRRR